MWFIGVEVEQETSAPPPKKNPGFAPAYCSSTLFIEQNMLDTKARSTNARSTSE